MKNSLSIVTLALASSFVMACGGDDDGGTTPDTAVADTATGDTLKGETAADTLVAETPTDTPSDTPTTPAPPTLGDQIDRMGRPAINTALNSSFSETGKGAAKDAYNGDKDKAGWSAKYLAEFEKNLAIIDAIDGNCGNQLFADKTKTDKSRYATLAGVLADDRLWVNTKGATCGAYLGVEANATKFLVNTDCGGRKPEYEVMKLSYGALAAGVYDATAVTDGTTAAAKSKVATFPYLAPGS
jgi:hypothetical protein